MRFSDRFGFTSVKEAFQFDGMDNKLRLDLWNLFFEFCNESGSWFYQDEEFERIIWGTWLNRPIDELVNSYDSSSIFTLEIKKYFFRCDFFEIYNLLEYIIFLIDSEEVKNDYKSEFNHILEVNKSGYKVVDIYLIKVISDEEINSIESALSDSENSDPTKKHLRHALSLLADRSSPDYRNSIKESISAVESLAKQITGNNKASLGELLKTLPDNFHIALTKGFSNIYGWTNDSNGIRHAMSDSSEIYYEDAVFMLVSCTAFINYLSSKARK